MTPENTPDSADPDAELRDRLADAMVSEAAFEGWSGPPAGRIRQLELRPARPTGCSRAGPSVLAYVSERAT